MRLKFSGQVLNFTPADGKAESEIALRIEHNELQVDYTGLILPVENSPAEINSMLTDLLTAQSVKVTIEVCQP